ncbi:MAG: choice-of-anchor D domain-containing protein [Burkholderiaceae bacterium]
MMASNLAAGFRTAHVGTVAALCFFALLAACGGGDSPASKPGSAAMAGRESAPVRPAPDTRTAASGGAERESRRAQPSAATAPFVTLPKIEAGTIDNLALKSDGTVWMWGRFHGFAPVQVGPCCGTQFDVTAITGPSYSAFAYALTSDGTVWTWSVQTSGGARNPVPMVGAGGTGTLTGVTAFAAGIANHELVLKIDGTVWAWGINESGELGTGNTTDTFAPVQVVGPGGIGLLGDVSAVARGGNHSLALKSDGTVWAWGGNADGKLGNNSIIDSSAPVQVVGADGTGVLSGVTAVAGGTDFSLALKRDGTVWAWGANGDGRLGNNSTVPSPFPVQVVGASGAGLLTGVTAIAAGRYHALALKNDGTVWAWGANGDGRLGNNSTVPSPFPVQVVGAGGAGVLSSITAISGGEQHSLALKSDGSLWAWGVNGRPGFGQGGQLGIPPSDEGPPWSLVPVQVHGPGDVGFLNLGVATAPVLTTSAASLDFGFVTVGTTRERTFVMSNSGPSVLSGSLAVGAPFFVVGNSAFQLAAGESATVTIGFSASVASRLEGTLDIQSNAGTSSIDVVAMGVAPPAFAPEIDRIAGPLPVGGVVTISGANFGASPGRLSIGGIEVGAIEFWGDLSIRARIPAGVHAGSQPVVVTTSAGSDRRRLLVLPPTPYLARLDEPRVTPGSELVVDGYNLGAQQATSRITIKHIEATVLRWSDTRIVVRVPDVPTGRWPLEVVTAEGSATRSVMVQDVPVLTRYGPCLPTSAETCPPIAGFANERRAHASLQFENTSDRWYEVLVTPSAAAVVTLPTGPLWLGPGGNMTLDRVLLPASASVKVELASATKLAVMLQTLDLLAKVCAEFAHGGGCPTLPLDTPNSRTLAAVQALLANPALVDAAAALQGALVAGFYVKAVDATAVFVNEIQKAGAVEPFVLPGSERAALARFERDLARPAFAYRVGSTLSQWAVFANAPISGSMTFTSR